jgi:hypothetical protein
VRRISVDTAIAPAAYIVSCRAAVELLERSTYDSTTDGMDHGEINGLVTR